MSRNGIILFLFLIGIAAATSWLRNRVTTEPEPQPEKTYAADSFMDQFRISQYSDSGQLAYLLNGARLEYFDNEGKTVITRPDISVQPDSPDLNWQVQAHQAVSRSRRLDEINFTGDVIFERRPNDGVAAVLLETGQILIKPKLELASTDGSVTIHYALSTISGEKLQADLKQGLFNMQRVQGRYVQ